MAKEQGINVSADALMEKYQEIAKMDEIIAAASGNDAAGKRAIANSIATETENKWAPTVEQILDAFTKLDENTLVGAFTGLTSRMKERYGETVDKYLEIQKEARKSDAPSVSEEELNATLASRREAVEQYKALRGILVTFGRDVSHVPEPKKHTGSRGKRGPRVFSKFVFSIDGVERPASQNNLSSIANSVCKDCSETGWKVADLKAFLQAQGLDLENPSDFSYELPNGKTISGVKSENLGDEDEDETEENENGDEQE